MVRARTAPLPGRRTTAAAAPVTSHRLDASEDRPTLGAPGHPAAAGFSASPETLVRQEFAFLYYFYSMLGLQSLTG